MSVPLNATFTGTESEIRRAFLDVLAAEGQGERNVAAHALGVDRFAEYLAPRDLRAARDTDLEGFLSYLTELGVSAVSLKTYRKVVGRWLEFLREHHGGAAADAAAGTPPTDEAFEEAVEPRAAVPAFAEPAVDEDAGSMTVILDRTPAPQPAAFPVFEPDPTTPMMKSVVEASDQEAADTGSEPAFEPVEPARPVAELVGAEAGEPDFEPAAAPAAGFEPPDGDDEPAGDSGFEPVQSPRVEEETGAEPSGFQPVEADLGQPDASTAGDDAEEGVDDSGAEFSFAPPPPVSVAPDAAFGESDAPAPEPETAEAATAFGDLPPAIDEADAFEAPELDEPARAAEERDRAKLAAPPLPDVEAAPAASVPGESEFEGPSSSIPLAGKASTSLEATGPKNDRTHRAAVTGTGRAIAVLDPTNGAMATQPGTGKWGLRRPQGERLDLSLDAIMTMAVSGELKAEHLVRKPSGQWVTAADLRPLRRALGLDGGPSTMVRQARTERTLGRAAAGAVVAGLFSGLLWWVTALFVGAELVPLAILGGLLGGFGARLAGQEAGLKIGALGAGAAPLSVLVGRYLVYETLSSGIALEGFQEIGGLGSFLGSGLGTTQAICLGLGALAGLLVGSVGGR